MINMKFISLIIGVALLSIICTPVLAISMSDFISQHDTRSITSSSETSASILSLHQDSSPSALDNHFLLETSLFKKIIFSRFFSTEGCERIDYSVPGGIII